MSVISALLQAVALVAATAGYAMRWRRVRARSGPSAASGWRLAWFCCAMLALALAVVFPLAALAQRVIVLHVAQHILVFDVAPILLVASATPAIVAPLLPAFARLCRSRMGWALRPWPIVVIYGLTLWLVHVPPLFDAALEVPALHVLQHAALLAVGTLFWWQELAPPQFRRTGEFTSVFYLVAGKMLSGVVASVLAFVPSALYAYYDTQESLWGLGPLDAQRMAGGILILVEGVIFLTAVAILMIRLIGESGHDRVDPVG